MGRPLNKKYFGSPALPGSQIVLNSAWIPGESAAINDCYIVKQVGTGRYLVKNGTKSGVVRLVQGVPAKAGEGQLIVKPHGGGTDESAKMVHSRTVKTWEGKVYSWSAAAASATGQATMRFIAAPTATATVTIAGNLTVGSVVTATVSALVGGTVTSYQWKLGAANVGTNSPTFTTTAAGSLTVVVTLTNAEGVTSTATSNALTIV